MSKEMEEYVNELMRKIDEIYEIARKARSLGYDPELEPEIPRAGDLAERVEKLVGPQGVAEAIRELDKVMPREELALKLVDMIVDGKFGKMDEQAAAEQAIRTALAVLTEGIVIAPIEGITHVEIKKNFDGSPYLALYFASPIRAAGGTAAALAVLAGDFVRRRLYLSPYKPDKREIERFVEEVEIYRTSIAHEQYAPPPEDIRFAVENLPVEITGEPTERDITVTAFRDLERIGHNLVRGGAVLALTEGVMQKAPKILKHVNKLNIDGWGWLSDLVSKVPVSDSTAPVFPKGDIYLSEVIAGRPVFSHPGTEGHRGRDGGFRLRYGRARNTGIAAVGVHPATMVICDDFIAVGTQLKTERPGKGGAVAPVDSIEGPVVKLKDGSVVRIGSAEEALELRDRVEEILFLGDILIGFGEFLENNHPLMPAGYCEEWWAQEVKRALAGKEFEPDPSQYLSPPYPTPAPSLAIRMSEELGVPLHPAYTYPYHDLRVEELAELGGWLASGEPEFENGELKRLRIQLSQIPKRVLEELGVPHRVDGGQVVIEEHALPLCRCLGLLDGQRLTKSKMEEVLRSSPAKDTMEIVQELAGFPVRKKAPTRIGARMGRPEKANPRQMKPPVHVLFPVGMRGGMTRSLIKATKGGEVYAEVANLECPKCRSVGFTRKCQKCGAIAEFVKTCPRCGRPVADDRCPVCNVRVEYFSKRALDLKALFEAALERLQEKPPELVKGVQGMTSAYKIPEPIEKGILRAKHGVYVFKDGTIRFDATNLPLTHFRPREIDTPVERLRELGYTKDIHGNPLENEDQILELKVQDVILSRTGAEYLFRASKFVDELLQKLYGLPPYYNAARPEDLVGHIVVGLAPHTSVGIAGRIIGFTDASVGYAHPFFHAAKRRDADGDEDAVILLLDALLNFSKRFLPSTRGGSISSDTKLLVVGINDEVRYLSVKDFWDLIEANGGEVERDGPYQIMGGNGWRSFTFDKQSFKSLLMKIDRIIRYPMAGKLLEVETQFGRKIKITRDHSLFVYRGKEIEEIAGADLRVGDFLVAPKKLHLEEGTEKLDLLEMVEDSYVFLDNQVRGELRKIWRNAPRRKRHAFGSGLSYILGKKKISAKKLRSILVANGANTDLMDVKVGLRRSQKTVNRVIPLNEDFMWLLGLFVAEGSLSGTNPTISVSNENLKKKVVQTANKIFGVVPSVRWSNKAYSIEFPSVIRELLFSLGFKKGGHPKDKIIPQIVLRAKEANVAAFLLGLNQGDGSNRVDAENYFSTVNFFTTSENVKDGIIFLLHKLGIVSSVAVKERKEPRKVLYIISVSGGKDVNALREAFRGEKPYDRKSLVIPVPSELMHIRENSGIPGVKKLIPRYLRRRCNISLQKLRKMVETLSKHRESLPENQRKLLDKLWRIVEGDLCFLKVNKIREVANPDKYVYDLKVNGRPVFLANWIYAHNSMDAPLIFSTSINPAEIDKEAHNMDVMERYPLEFYEATQRYASPVETAKMMETVECRLGTEAQYEGLKFSFDTSDIAAGPHSSRYKTLETMEEKTSAQLELAKKIRAVDERDVAERLIEHHFIPDLKGNIRTFASQNFRCVACNSIHRRVPLSGVCNRCGGKLVLTVTRGGVEKYLQVAMRVADDYHVSEYTKQRLGLARDDIKSMFESDARRQLSLADFL